jgi:hypothetical protein
VNFSKEKFKIKNRKAVFKRHGRRGAVSRR